MIRLLIACSGLFALSLLAPSVFADSPNPSSDVAQTALQRASEMLQAEVEAGKIAGGAHLVVRDGRVLHFKVLGVADAEDRTPLKPDTIMRIYSMTKPITSVAAMVQWERGKFQLDDAVADYIPAFKQTKVIVTQDGESKLVQPARPITVRDLFRHSAGFSYGDEPNVNSFYESAGVRYHGLRDQFPPEMTIAEAADALAGIPLRHDPGARFTYGFNTDLLGRLVEIWSGKTLDAALQETVLEPLQMVDTGFAVPPEKRHRFASCHTMENGRRIIADKAGKSPFLGGFAFLSGGGGLVSTMGDYANFCQMLVDGGQFEGQRLLKEDTLQLMFSNQLAEAEGPFQFGLGFAIREVQTGKPDVPHPIRAFYWGGYANTAFQVVPELKMFQIFMRQSVPSDHRVANALFPVVWAGLDPGE